MRSSRKPSPHVMLLLVGLMLSIATVPGTSKLLQPLAAQTVDFYPIATGLTSPTDIANAGDYSGRLFIVQQGGRIRIFDWNTFQVLPTDFLNITSRVTSGGEMGLLGLAFHPDYVNNGYFYVNYTTALGGPRRSIIARYSVTADPNVADPASEQILLTVPQPVATNHKGGCVKFGWDGYLYFGFGDGGSQDDPGNRAQNPAELLGKMLRIDVNNPNPPYYSIPPDNPFVGVPGYRQEIWALGLRNPWRFSFDRYYGDLYIGDVGGSAREEIDYQPWYSTGGENYGWVCREGFIPRLPLRPFCVDQPQTVDPIIDYPRTQGVSVTGGFVYRGYFNPSLEGKYIYADYGSRRVWGAYQNKAGVWINNQIATAPSSVSTFGEDENGELYMTGYSNGTVYWIYTY